MTVRIAAVASHPIQYYSPLYREMARTEGIALQVLYCCDWGLESYVDPGFNAPVKWDIPLVEGFDHVFLPIRSRPERLGFWEVDNPTVGEALSAFDADVVIISGYAKRTNWRAVAWARRRGRVVIMTSDSNLKGHRSWTRRVVKELVVRQFYDRVDGALFMNDNNRAYHVRYGMPDARLFPAAMPIDRSRLLGSLPDRAAARRETRARHGIPDDAFVVVQCAKYLARKRPTDVVAAAATAARRGVPAWALLVGEGPERAEIEAFCAREGVTNVTLTGFVNQSTLPAYYAASDVVALASDYEPHGVVVAEAAAFGLPALVSDLVGAAGPQGVARPDVNAIIYPCGDRDRLAGAIESLYSDRATYDRLSEGANQISFEQDAVHTAHNYARAASEIRRLGPRRGGKR
jgi:glycosyltransferase involved in cell wall biosynthesis